MFRGGSITPERDGGEGELLVIRSESVYPWIDPARLVRVSPGRSLRVFRVERLSCSAYSERPANDEFLWADTLRGTTAYPSIY